MKQGNTEKNMPIEGALSQMTALARRSRRGGGRVQFSGIGTNAGGAKRAAAIFSPQKESGVRTDAALRRGERRKISSVTRRKYEKEVRSDE